MEKLYLNLLKSKFVKLTINLIFLDSKWDSSNQMDLTGFDLIIFNSYSIEKFVKFKSGKLNDILRFQD